MADNPDVSSILARLAQFSQPQSQSHPVSQQDSSAISSSTAQQILSTGDHQQYATPQTRSTTTQTRPIIDPATITTWQEGLRCVTKMAAQNRSFESSIRKMMHNQRSQEMKWYAERQELKRLHATRSKSSADALVILNSLNPSNTLNASETSTEDSNAAELAKLDRKIYDGQLSLEESMSANLKSLGVPFFGTPDALISLEANQTALDHLPKYSQPVTLQQIQDLRRRMIAHLEDLYSD